MMIISYLIILYQYPFSETMIITKPLQLSEKEYYGIEFSSHLIVG